MMGISIFTRRTTLDSNKLITFILQGTNLKKCIAFIYKDNFSTIEKMVLKMHGNKVDAEDVFRYSLSKLIWFIQEGYIEQTANLKEYIYTLCRKLWVNTLKRKSNYSYYTFDVYHKHYNPTILENLPFINDNLFFHREFSDAYTCCKPVEYDSKASVSKLGIYWNSLSTKIPKLST